MSIGFPLADYATSAGPTEAQISLGGWDPSPALQSTHEGQATSVMNSLYRTAEALPAAFDRAATFRDPDLTPEAQERGRQDRVKALTTEVESRVKALTRHLEFAVKAADEAAEPHRPKLDPDNLAQLARTDQAWNSIIRPQLDAGKEWSQIVPLLDHDGILATERFAPAYESGKRGQLEQREVPGVLAGLRQMTERQVVEGAPEGPARDALRAHQRVQEVAGAARSAMQALSDVRMRSEAVSAQIGIKRLAFQVGAQSAPGATPASA